MEHGEWRRSGGSEDEQGTLTLSGADLTKILRKVVKEMRLSQESQGSKSDRGGVMDSLLKRLSDFSYDPDNGVTFDLWFSRYEETIATDGSTLDDAAKVRLVVQKLDQLAYQKYAAHILPRKFAELKFEETIETLKNLFGHQGSVFARRYKFLQTCCTDSNGGTFDDYTGTVNKRFEMAEMSTISPDQMKCLIWICRLKEAKPPSAGSPCNSQKRNRMRHCRNSTTS